MRPLQEATIQRFLNLPVEFYFSHPFSRGLFAVPENQKFHGNSL